jgi:hypothetical protein
MRTVHPAGAAAWTARATAMSAGEDQRVRAAPASGDERAAAGGRVVGDPDVRGARGGEYPAGLGGHTAAVDHLARWQGDDRHRGRRGAPVAVQGCDLLAGGVSG